MGITSKSSGGAAYQFEADQNLIACVANTERSHTGNTTWTLKKAITLNELGGVGTLKVSFQMKSADSTTVQARIYKNGVALGSTQSQSGTTYVTKREDIAGWTNGSILQLYVKCPDTYATVYVQQLHIEGRMDLVTGECFTVGTD